MTAHDVMKNCLQAEIDTQFFVIKLFIKEKMSHSVLDTFAGAGGFGLGFQLAGAQTIGAIEMDQWACETFQFNHPTATVMQGDITAMTDAQILAAFGEHRPDITQVAQVYSQTISAVDAVVTCTLQSCVLTLNDGCRNRPLRSLRPHVGAA